MNARRLLIHSCANMRDLGGYPTLDGKVTKFGRFIRSDAPLNLSAADISFLHNYGLKTVFDLRTEDEAALAPNPLKNAKGIDYRNISFTDDFSMLGSMDFCPLKHYVPIMKGSTRVKEILEGMANCPDGAVLFHCAAGKDRTGIIAALLLLNADVPAEDAAADYQVTFTYIKKIIYSLKSSPERPVELCRTEPEWIEPLIAFFLEKGSARAYLESIGLSGADIERLREKMVG